MLLGDASWEEVMSLALSRNAFKVQDISTSGSRLGVDVCSSDGDCIISSMVPGWDTGDHIGVPGFGTIGSSCLEGQFSILRKHPETRDVAR